MKDIIASKEKALVDQGWLFGERMNRIGNPFVWVDGDQLPDAFNQSGPVSVLQYLAMSGEIYPLHEELSHPKAKSILDVLTKKLALMVGHFAPFLGDKHDFKMYIDSTASVKQQDYCFIVNFCEGLKKRPRHLDIGPGLGANCIYSLDGLNGRYYSLEAFPASYQVQREFFRFLSSPEVRYLDPIECENLGLQKKDMAEQINSDRYRIIHLPSWHCECVKQESLDLVTATWVLNDVTPSGIVWLMYNINRALSEKGYLYIRDSFLKKPMRHGIDYDEFFKKIGFEHVKTLNVKNRVDMHGIPRAYRKIKHHRLSFMDVFNMCVDRFSVTAHAGAYMQDAGKRKQG